MKKSAHELFSTSVPPILHPLFYSSLNFSNRTEFLNNPNLLSGRAQHYHTNNFFCFQKPEKRETKILKRKTQFFWTHRTLDNLDMNWTNGHWQSDADLQIRHENKILWFYMTMSWKKNFVQGHVCNRTFYAMHVQWFANSEFQSSFEIFLKILYNMLGKYHGTA